MRDTDIAILSIRPSVRLGHSVLCRTAKRIVDILLPANNPIIHVFATIY